MKKLIVLLLLIMMCAGCSVSPSHKPTPSPDSSQNTGCAVEEPCTDEVSETADMSEYGLDGHVFIETTYSDVLKMIESKRTAVIYIGRPTCPWCQDAVPVLNEIAKEYDMDIHYVFTRSDYNQSDAGQQAKDELILYMHDYLNENDEGEKALFVPDVLFIKNGEIAGNHINTVEGYQPSEREMNDEEIEQLKSIYRSYFERISE